MLFTVGAPICKSPEIVVGQGNGYRFVLCQSKAPKPVVFGGQLLCSQKCQQSQGNRQSAREQTKNIGFFHKGYLLL